MNYSVVIYILGWIMEIEAAFLALPGIVSAIYGEKGGFAFLWVALGSAVAGSAIILRKPKNMRFYLREGFVTVALSWILMSVIGCLPFVINGDIPHFADALFEMISGFTTTGATVVSDVEGLTKGSLFWRSFSHWIGGMGVLVFLLAIVPMAGGSHMNLMKAESPGPSVGKLVPKVRQTAKYLYIIYFALTMIEVIFLLFGGMNLFEALTTSFGTAGTGGFAIWNDGFVSVSPYNQWVVTIFMLLFGVNFGFYFLILTGKLRDALKFEEVRIYFIIVIAAAVFIFILLGSSPFPDSRAEQQHHRENLQSACQHIEHQNIFRKIRKMSEIRHRSNQRKPRTDIVKRRCYCREVRDQIFVLNRHKQYGYRENNHICHKIDICRPQRLMLEWFSLDFDLLHGTRMQIRNNFFYK